MSFLALDAEGAATYIFFCWMPHIFSSLVDYLLTSGYAPRGLKWHFKCFFFNYYTYLCCFQVTTLLCNVAFKFL